MQTTYTDFKIQNDESFGDDHITFFIYAHQNGKKAYLFLTYHYFIRFLEGNFPPEAEYINNIRKSLGGYGMKEKEVVDILLEEEFDFQKYLIAYIESEENLVEEEIKRQNRIHSQPQMQEQIKQSLEKLDALKPHNPIKTSKFLDDLEKVILNHLLSQYPELTEGEPEDIKKLQHILIRTIPNFGEKIINLIYQIRDKK